MKFIDYIKIFCKSGNGGAGAIHFYRNKFIKKGGPDGGNGGNGGNIIFQGDKNISTLFTFKYNKYHKAENGNHGGKNRITGSSGKDKIIKVPLGTLIKNEKKKKIFQINKDGEKKILIKGGKGGRGNWNFKNSIQQAPFYAQKGQKGKEICIILEFKIFSDVGIIGFPNSGKSTLLSVLTSAKPKIADYPFTTVIPNLGIIFFKNYLTITIIDIPGIIKGTVNGKGLGSLFFRHIEYNKILLFIISAESSKEDIIEKYNILLYEIKKYNRFFLKKKKILVISKSDLIKKNIKKEIEKKIPKNQPYVFISSVKKIGLKKLKKKIFNIIFNSNN